MMNVKIFRNWQYRKCIITASGNGGIWIQPLNLPKQPRLKNVIDIGTLICTKKDMKKTIQVVN